MLHEIFDARHIPCRLKKIRNEKEKPVGLIFVADLVVLVEDAKNQPIEEVDL